MTDFSQLDALLNRIVLFSESAIPVAAEVVRTNLLDRTTKGKDSDNQTFTKWGKGHNYSPAQEERRKALGLPTNKKTISVTFDTLSSIALRNPSGALAPKNGTELATDNAHMSIMVGQMRHPGWRYHHNVMGTNEGDAKAIDVALSRNARTML